MSEVSLPIAFDLVEKNEQYLDPKTGKQKRRSPLSKNQRYLMLLRITVHNQIPFRYVLNDVWFASAKNMKYVKVEPRKDSIMPLKGNRKVALSESDKQKGRFVAVKTLELPARTSREVWLAEVPFPVQLIKQVFINDDDLQGISYLVTCDLILDYDQIRKLFQNDGVSRSITNRSSKMLRWNIPRRGRKRRNAINYSPVCAPS